MDIRKSPYRFFIQCIISKPFYFALQGVQNQLKGSNYIFTPSTISEHKKEGFRQVIQPVESLYFKRFSHIQIGRAHV